jgi:hypothetical protein
MKKKIYFIFILFINSLFASEVTSNLNGKWMLIEIESKDGIEKELFRMKIKHPKGEGIARSLVETIDTNDGVYLRRDVKNGLSLAYYVQNEGSYEARLKYIKGRFESKKSEWLGQLYLNGEVVKLVSLHHEVNWSRNKAFIGEYSENDMEAMGKEESKNSRPNGKLAGNWFFSKDDVDETTLLRVQLMHVKGEETASGGIDLFSEDIGKFKNSQLLVELKAKKMILKFETTNGVYVANLEQVKEDESIEQLWKGTLKHKGKISKVQFMKLKRQILKSEQIPYAFPSNLYDLKKNKKDLAFICKEKSCVYHDKKTGLKIPLNKNWAIEEPYYHETMTGMKKTVPSIMFVNIKSALWMGLNQMHIMRTPDFVFCVEFGKNGRYSSEESLCIVNALSNEKDQIEASIFMENIETWRDKSYN